jgi:DNA-binding NarL/FixJ family response regulator
VGELLAREAGLEIEHHFSGPDELLRTLATNPPPDVILLDIQMGERNGLDAVRPIKSLAPRTRVLMFTTFFNPEWQERALFEGASDYLLKTDGIQNVAARIRSPVHDKSPKTFSCRPKVASPMHLAENGSSLLRRSLGALRLLPN